MLDERIEFFSNGIKYIVEGDSYSADVFYENGLQAFWIRHDAIEGWEYKWIHPEYEDSGTEYLSENLMQDATFTEVLEWIVGVSV